ncbi:phospholipid transporting ATPase, partial [Coemansia sp. RSA 551]
MILNFFYKNVVFTISLFWFQIYCQWSVANIFDYTIITLYNMLFTSLPPGALGVLDQDLPAFAGAVVPQLYKRGLYKLEYSMARFWMYIADGMYQSAVIVFLVVYTYYFSFAGERNGLDSANGDDLGTVGAFSVILATNLYMAMNNRSWTWVMPLALFIGIALLVGVFFVYGVIYNTEFSSGAAVRIFAQPNFWFMLALTSVLCLLPHYMVKFVRSAWYPTDTDVVREIVHKFRRRGRNGRPWTKPSDGVLDFATTSPHKEVPFGAIPERRPFGAHSEHRPFGAIPEPRLMRRHRQSAGIHHMEGAIPLNDMSAITGSRAANQPTTTVDALNRPGLYQGIQYPEQDTELVAHLHSLAHGENLTGFDAGAGTILKRLSVHQKQRGPLGTGVGSSVALDPEPTHEMDPDLSQHRLRHMESRA